MIIVFFHLLFLLDKYVWRKYREIQEEFNEMDGKPVAGKPCEIEDRFYDEDSPTNIKFSPPAYVQRYVAVRDILTSPKYKGKIRKVVDFGCSEFGFFTHLKHTPVIEEVLCVDVDRRTLDMNIRKIQPLTVDYINSRDRPLNVFVYEGSVTDNDKVLENCDAVVAIELIEHLYQETLLNVPQNIFGFIKPKVAIITTPNADFNVLFGPMTDFRHYDHKFEWSRHEFEKWSHNIIDKYPDYEVTFHGICQGPEGTEHLGCCTQMAVFHRKLKAENTRIPSIEGLFKLVASEEYPFRLDNRSDEAKILDEATFFIRKFQMRNDDEVMPLDYLTRVLDNLNITVDSLKNILENGGFEIVDTEENGPSVVCPVLSTDSGNLMDDLYDETLNEDAFLSGYESPDEPGPVNYFTNWPPIRSEDNWDEDWDESIAVAVDQAGSDADVSNLNSETTDLDEENELPSGSLITTIDLQNLDISNNIPNHSRVTSNGDRESIQISSYPETSMSNQESRLDSEDLKQLTKDDSIHSQSMCSMYLEAPCNENSLMCPENITDPNFQHSIMGEHNLSITENGASDVSFTSIDNDTLQLTSTPYKKRKITINCAECDEPDVCRNYPSSECASIRKLNTLIDKNVATSSCESPPNSWSPEIMDSGYPNTCSAPDMTPEYDLPSIAQDSASDSESSSAAEPPRQAFLEHIQVENGDLANNNRDGEGNNMMAVQNDIEDLQPLIDVLENDMENENDIYVFQNGFPAWLLRIQDIEAAVINQPAFLANNAPAGHDEGFSSSESERVDENQNKDEDTDNEDVENMDANC